MRLTFYGSQTDFLDDAFYNSDAGGFEPDILSASPTRVVISNPSTGYVSTATGTGLNPQSEPPGGTLTGIEIRDDSNRLVAELTDFSWSLAEFANAMDVLMSTGDDGPLYALLERGEVIFDARPSGLGTEIDFEGLDTNVRIFGSSQQDTLGGGLGDDTIRPGGTDNGEFIDGSPGNDRIDLSQHQPETWVELRYDRLSGPIQAVINGAANTGRVDKGALGVDTIVDPLKAMQAWGLNFTATHFDDTITVYSGPSHGFGIVAPLGGDDTINLTLASGTIRLGYMWQNPLSGVNVNLANGLVQNDGFGGTDTLDIIHAGGRLEVEGTNNDDTITGSAANERYILGAGNDTLDARGGHDMLRLDNWRVQGGVEADLQAGTVSGTWDGVVFNHQVRNVEEIWGSGEGDTIHGSASDETIEGNGGDDVISGRGGNDRLRGDAGNDRLMGGAGRDNISGGSGNDYIDPGDNDFDYDYVDPGSGDDTVDAGNMSTGSLTVGHYGLAEAGVAMTFDIDGTANTGTIVKAGNGTTTLLDVVNPMNAWGLSFNGSRGDDRFNLTVSDAGWMSGRGGRGNDTFDLGSSDGTIRLDYRVDNTNGMPTTGIVADLAAGTITDGMGGTDTVIGVGNPGRLEIRATDMADRLVGTNGNESFIPLAGNDTVDGGGGNDRLRYNQNGAEAGIDADLKAGTITGVWSGAAFTHSVANIEAVLGTGFGDMMSGKAPAGGNDALIGQGGDDWLFGDGFDAASAPEDAAAVYRVYQSTLDREPDSRGLQNWTEQLFTGESSLQEVTRGFVNSPEFQNTYGALDDAGFVTLLYNNVLGRDPDAGGLANWTGQLEAGTSRAEVVLGFAQSAEFVQETAEAARSFTLDQSQAAWSDDVYRVYRATLDRAPDLTGFNNWTGQLTGDTPLQSVVSGFVNSTEFQNTYGALDDAGFVTLLYNNVLGRNPDAGGLANWTDQLEAGTSRAEVVLGFAQSSEFVRDTAADLKDWMRGLDHGLGWPEHDWLDGGSGNNVLSGGLYADTFVFSQGDGGSHQVLDLEAWDRLNFRDFGYGSMADAKAHMTLQGEDTIFDDQGTTITFENTRLAEITDDMFWG